MESKIGCKPNNNINLPRKWSQLSYAGENRVPPSDEPTSGAWPTFFIKRNSEGAFIDNDGNPIAFEIRQPDVSIDFEGYQLEQVQSILEQITDEQIDIAKYWGDGPPTKQWTPIIDILIDTYNISAPRAGRVLAAVQGAINDAFVIAWYFKFLWDIPRPNQLDQELETILCTPYHPSYPSGHSTISGCAQVVLSYFFKAEADRLRELAEECGVSRIYGGVHYPVDNEEGLGLGRQIGEIVVNYLKSQGSKDGDQIDYPILQSKDAVLPPPPYEQVIPYERTMVCKSKIKDEIECDRTPIFRGNI